jgi:hypothetical protein
MKKSVFFWSILAVVFGVFTIEHGRSIAAGPVQFKPNWLAILPVVAIWAALIGLIIRKELTAGESGTRKEKAELAAVYASAPLDDLT